MIGGAISVNPKEDDLEDMELEFPKICMVIGSRHGFGRNNIEPAFHNRYTNREDKYAAYRIVWDP